MISVEDIKEYAKQTFDKLKEVINDLIKAIVEGIDNLMNGITKADHVLSKAEEALNTGGNVFSGVGSTFTLKNPSPIFANGVNKLHDTKMLTGLTHFTTIVYPEALRDYYRDIANRISQYNVVKGDGAEYAQRLLEAPTPLDDLYGQNEEVFPGNAKVVLHADGIVYGMGHAGSAKPAPETAEIKVSEPGKLRENLKNLRNIMEMLKTVREEHAKIKVGADAVQKAIAKVEEKLNNDDLDDASKEAARKVIQVGVDMLRVSNPRSREIIRYVTRTVAAYATVYMQEINILKQPAKD